MYGSDLVTLESSVIHIEANNVPEQDIVCLTYERVLVRLHFPWGSLSNLLI